MGEEFEQKVVYRKKYTCPVCEKEFSSLRYMATKLKTDHKELDLRVVYEDIDTRKYEPVVCTNCGYADFDQGFEHIVERQKASIREAVTPHFKPYEDNAQTYSYSEAVKRYSLVMLTAVAKKSGYGDSANIFLKNAWLLRGIIENDACKECGMTAEDAAEKEKMMLSKALSCFNEAVQKENFPMCGMNEETINYLMAVLAYENEDYALASKLVGMLFAGRGISQRVKDKAYDLKAMIKEKLGEEETEQAK